MKSPFVFFGAMLSLLAALAVHAATSDDLLI
jgi:hypothetical protein